MRRPIAICSLATAALATTAFLASARAQSQQTTPQGQDPIEQGVFIARGDFDVRLMTEGNTNTRVLDRVTEVSLLRDWTVIQRTESGKNVTLVVPRDALISLEMSD